jgi:hypothetical protein
MNRLVAFLIIFLIGNSFLMLEEESVVILASLVWLDAAGSSIREALRSELESRGDVIKETFVWYLKAKTVLIGLLLSKHEGRTKLADDLSNVYGVFVESLLAAVLSGYHKDLKVVSHQERRNDMMEVGLSLVNELSRREIQIVLGHPSRWEFSTIDKSLNWLDKAIKGRLLV